MSPVIVGTPVHYYTKDPDEQSNSAGMGPYYAVVTQVFPGSDYANLIVFAPFKEPYHAGSVQVRGAAFDAMTGAELPTRWYEPMQVTAVTQVEIDRHSAIAILKALDDAAAAQGADHADGRAQHADLGDDDDDED